MLVRDWIRWARPATGSNCKKPRLPAMTFGTHSSTVYSQSQYISAMLTRRADRADRARAARARSEEKQRKKDEKTALRKAKRAEAEQLGLGYALNHRGSLRRSRNANISVPMSVLRAAPAGDDAVLVAQGNVTVRVLACSRVIRRITDAGTGGDRDDLLNRGAGLVPNFDFVGQILPIDRNGLGRSTARNAIFAIAGWRQAQ
jgi:hypothetical protein